MGGNGYGITAAGISFFRENWNRLFALELTWIMSFVAHPQESEKAYLDPVGLVRSLRDWEGRPLDVMLQQDASEFLTLFFQQVRAYPLASFRTISHDPAHEVRM